jgi:type I restriction-modification system DNA methylase subunit
VFFQNISSTLGACGANPQHSPSLKKEKPLTPQEKQKLMQNFHGYDIDPTMERIAAVNMYLHQFKNPKIS